MNNITLRPMAESDLAEVYAWRTKPEILRYLDSTGELTMAQHMAWFAGMQLDDTREYFIICAGGTPCGVIFLKNINWRVQCAEVGIYVGAVHGKGIGTGALHAVIQYAFSERNLNKLWATVFDFNPRSQRLFERCGFQREGVQRQEIIDDDDGSVHDIVRYGLLQSEYTP